MQGARSTVAMFDRKSKILLILPEDMLDRARALAGVLTTKLKRPVSLQMVIRGFVDEGLKRGRDRAFLDNVDAQVRAVRRIRRRLPSGADARANLRGRSPVVHGAGGAGHAASGPGRARVMR